MVSEPTPAELLEVREQIDTLDREIIELLAQRFRLTHRVGKLKASLALQSLDARREEEKLAEIRSLCARHGLNADLVTALFTQIMEEVVRNHNRLREQDS